MLNELRVIFPTSKEWFSFLLTVEGAYNIEKGVICWLFLTCGDNVITYVQNCDKAGVE